MKILAIETSCDDTAIAILEAEGDTFKVLSNIVSSQKIHEQYGGVFPMMAQREHQKNIVPILEKALEESKLLHLHLEPIDPEQLKKVEKILEKEPQLLPILKAFLEKNGKPTIDLIAVTNGPGLEPCLWVGVNVARVLSLVWGIPIVPVNHIEGHILVNFLNHKSYIINPKEIFPAISLVVSGGHTQLILMRGIGKYKIIGETRDDAAGECFDKTAKILGLGYPGGPIIAQMATGVTETVLELPRPMVTSPNYDFSFSGLKTAVLYKVRDWEKENIKNQKFIKEMCFEIQQTIIDVLLKKTINAAKSYKAKTVILGGGVSANQELRRQLQEKIQKDIPNTKYLIPDTALSTDNALMIAITGFFHQKKVKSWKTLKANANLRISS